MSKLLLELTISMSRRRGLPPGHANGSWLLYGAGSLFGRGFPPDRHKQKRAMMLLYRGLWGPSSVLDVRMALTVALELP